MVNTFTLKSLFTPEERSFLVQNFGLNRMAPEELQACIEEAFQDYILSALSEMGDQRIDKTKIYLEARYHLDKSRKLLEAMPHPAGKMSYRLSSMCDTLDKLITGDNFSAASRASRFMEKNLVRKLRDIWNINTSTPFHSGSDASGKNPRDYLLFCFNAAKQQYPEITWFGDIDERIADGLIKATKR